MISHKASHANYTFVSVIPSPPSPSPSLAISNNYNSTLMYEINFLKLQIDSSVKQYTPPTDSSPSTPLCYLQLSPIDPLPHHLLSEKRMPPKDKKHTHRGEEERGRERYSKTRQKPSHQGRMKQPNSKKRVPRAENSVKNTPAPTVRSHIIPPS